MLWIIAKIVVTGIILVYCLLDQGSVFPKPDRSDYPDLDVSQRPVPLIYGTRWKK